MFADIVLRNNRCGRVQSKPPAMSSHGMRGVSPLDRHVAVKCIGPVLAAGQHLAGNMLVVARHSLLGRRVIELDRIVRRRSERVVLVRQGGDLILLHCGLSWPRESLQSRQQEVGSNKSEQSQDFEATMIERFLKISWDDNKEWYVKQIPAQRRRGGQIPTS